MIITTLIRIPDGPNNPGHPFEVFCDFAKNRTLVPYAEQKSSQIKDWILNRSGSCWQDFTMDCQAVTYNLNGTPNAWWLDNACGKQYFFNGSFDSLNIDHGFKCIGNHGKIQADWLLPNPDFEQPNPTIGEYEVKITKRFMKFTTIKFSVFAGFKVNNVQHVEAKLNRSGLLKMKVSGQEKEIKDEENRQES